MIMKYNIMLLLAFFFLEDIQVMGDDHVKTTTAIPTVTEREWISRYGQRELRREQEESCRRISKYKNDCERGFFNFRRGFFGYKNPMSCYEFANWMERFLNDPFANSECRVFFTDQKRPLLLFETFPDNTGVLRDLMDRLAEYRFDRYVISYYEIGCHFEDGRACRRLGEMEEEKGNMEAAQWFYERSERFPFSPVLPSAENAETGLQEREIRGLGTRKSPFLLHVGDTFAGNRGRFVHQGEIKEYQDRYLYYLIEGLPGGRRYKLELVGFKKDLDLSIDYIYNERKRGLGSSGRAGSANEEVSFYWDFSGGLFVEIDNYSRVDTSFRLKLQRDN